MEPAIKLTNDRLPRLIIKYSIIVIILELITRFAMIYILQLYQHIFPLENNSDIANIENINNIVRGVVVLILNLAVAFILLSDLDRKKILTWILLGLTLLNPWMSIIFFLIWKAAEIKNYA